MGLERNATSTKPCQWVVLHRVSIKQRVNRFELHVDQAGLDENGQPILFVMKEMFKAVEAFHHSFWRRGNKWGVSRTAAANPVL